jgi:hypothetical protein
MPRFGVCQLGALYDTNCGLTQEFGPVETFCLTCNTIHYHKKSRKAGLIISNNRFLNVLFPRNKLSRNLPGRIGTRTSLEIAIQIYLSMRDGFHDNRLVNHWGSPLLAVRASLPGAWEYPVTYSPSKSHTAEKLKELPVVYIWTLRFALFSFCWHLDADRIKPS